MIMLLNFIILALGFACLIFGADRLVYGSIAIAKRLHISQIVIGLTIVSLGTSMPELIISLMGSFGGNTGIALGNVVGSNICNILLILGISGLLSPHPLKLSHVVFDSMIATGGVVLVLLFSVGGTLSRIEGGILLLVFVAYMWRLIRSATKTTTAMTDHPATLPDVASAVSSVQSGSIPKAVVFLFIGLSGLFLGGQVVVRAASAIALDFGMSEKLVGLTIVAIGTSLPELVTCVAAVRKGNPDLAIGNVVGSNILNLYFILGTTMLIAPIAYDPLFYFDLAVLLVASTCILMFIWIGKKNTLDRWGAGMFFAGYISYLAYSIVSR